MRATELRVSLRFLVALTLGVAFAAGLRLTAAPEVACRVVVTTNDDCGGADARCRIVTLSGATTEPGDLNLEIDWDDGAGSGENQNVGGPDFSGTWIHSYSDNGLRHIRMEAEDASGAKCRVEHSEDISG
jgi:hypothetical protein